ncbi:MAG: hypothetical protein OQL28_14805 [Sedimenticola sp.]|nr:hypothetical protein [Sedimenticola sp.]
MNPDQAPTRRLKKFPIAFFAMIMGLAGLTIGWEKAPPWSCRSTTGCSP